MNRLVIFDVDGTLTDTTAVDDECYRAAIASVLAVEPSAIGVGRGKHADRLRRAGAATVLPPSLP